MFGSVAVGGASEASTSVAGRACFFVHSSVGVAPWRPQSGCGSGHRITGGELSWRGHQGDWGQGSPNAPEIAEVMAAVRV